VKDWGRIDLSTETREDAAATAAADADEFEISDPDAREAYANVELARRVHLHARTYLKETVRIAYQDAGVSDILLAHPLRVDRSLLQRMYLNDEDNPYAPNKDLPWDDIDRGIANLVRTINATMPGIETVSSCQGHPDRRPEPEPYWHVALILQAVDAEIGIEQGGPHPDGWLSIEWLTWLVNNDLSRTGYDVHMRVHAPPPYLNDPGRSLTFWIEAPVASPDRDTLTPDRFAELLLETWEEVGFHSPHARQAEDASE